MRLLSLGLGVGLTLAACGCPSSSKSGPSRKPEAPACRACLDGTHATGPRVVSATPAGLSIVPATGVDVPDYAADKGPAQVYEILRPAGQAVKLGRFFMDCTCVKASTDDGKTSFAPGERALVTVRQVGDAPAGGATYHLSVQVVVPEEAILTQPVRVGY